MSLDTALAIAAGGLRAAARSLAVVGANVANADTVGYTRKAVPRESVVVAGEGRGVRTADATRAVDEALRARVVSAGADAAAAAATVRHLAPIEALHGTPDSGDSLGGRVAALHDAFSALATTPEAASRQFSVIDAATRLASRLNGLTDGVAAQRQTVQDEIGLALEEANGALDQVAALTRQIRDHVATGRGTAELEDRRDAALATLAETMGLRAAKQADGGVLLYGPGGLAIDPGSGDRFSTAPATLSAGLAYDPPTGGIPPILLGGADPSATPLDVTARLSGGRVAALVTLRDSTLPRMQAELDGLAHGLATRFEQQGLRLFTDAAGTVPQNGLAPDPIAIVGFAAEFRVNPAVLTTPRLVRDGTHDVLAADPEPRGTPFGVNDPGAGGPEGFTNLARRILDQAFGAERAPGMAHVPIPANGLGPIGGVNASFPSPPTLQAHAATLVARQVSARAEASAAESDAASFRDFLGARFTRESGVDVDAEMALMVELQTAYAANARVLAAADEMWRTLLAAVR